MSASVTLANHLPEGKVEIPEGYKRCYRCGCIRQYKWFYLNKRSSDGLDYVCKLCINAYHRSYYQQNKSAKKQRTKQRGLLYKQQWEIWVRDNYDHKCIRCGYNAYFGALDAHHLDPSSKEIILSRFLKGRPVNKKNISYIEAELEKCVWLCSNCHRELHGNFFELTDAQVRESRKEN